MRLLRVLRNLLDRDRAENVTRCADPERFVVLPQKRFEQARHRSRR